MSVPIRLAAEIGGVALLGAVATPFLTAPFRDDFPQRAEEATAPIIEQSDSLSTEFFEVRTKVDNAFYQKLATATCLPSKVKAGIDTIQAARSTKVFEKVGQVATADLDEFCDNILKPIGEQYEELFDGLPLQLLRSHGPVANATAATSTGDTSYDMTRFKVLEKYRIIPSNEVEKLDNWKKQGVAVQADSPEGLFSVRHRSTASPIRRALEVIYERDRRANELAENFSLQNERLQKSLEYKVAECMSPSEALRRSRFQNGITLGAYLGLCLGLNKLWYSAGGLNAFMLNAANGLPPTSFFEALKVRLSAVFPVAGTTGGVFGELWGYKYIKHHPKPLKLMLVFPAMCFWHYFTSGLVGTMLSNADDEEDDEDGAYGYPFNNEKAVSKEIIDDKQGGLHHHHHGGIKDSFDRLTDTLNHQHKHQENESNPRAYMPAVWLGATREDPFRPERLSMVILEKPVMDTVMFHALAFGRICQAGGPHTGVIASSLLVPVIYAMSHTGSVYDLRAMMMELREDDAFIMNFLTGLNLLMMYCTTGRLWCSFALNAGIQLSFLVAEFQSRDDLHLKERLSLWPTFIRFLTQFDIFEYWENAFTRWFYYKAFFEYIGVTEKPKGGFLRFPEPTHNVQTLTDHLVANLSTAPGFDRVSTDAATKQAQSPKKMHFPWYLRYLPSPMSHYIQQNADKNLSIVMEKEDILDCLEALRHGLAVVDRRPSEELNFIERAKRAQYFMGLYALKLRVARMKEEHAKLKRSAAAASGSGADSGSSDEGSQSKHAPSASTGAGATSGTPALDVDSRFPMFGGGIGFGPFAQGPMAPGLGPGPGGPGGFSTNGSLGRSMSGYLSESTNRLLFDDCYHRYVDKLFPHGISRYQLEELIVFEMISWCSAKLRETLDFKKLKKILTYWEDIVDDPKGERQFLNFLELYHWSLLFELENEAEKFAESKIPEFYDKLAGRKALPEDIRQYEAELADWLRYSTRRATLSVLAPFGLTQRRFTRLLEMYSAKYESVSTLQKRWENYFQSAAYHQRISQIVDPFGTHAGKVNPQGSLSLLLDSSHANPTESGAQK